MSSDLDGCEERKTLRVKLGDVEAFLEELPLALVTFNHDELSRLASRAIVCAEQKVWPPMEARGWPTRLMQRRVLNNRCPTQMKPLLSPCSEVTGLLHATVMTCAAPRMFKVRKPLRPRGWPESADGCKEMNLSLPYFRLHSSRSFGERFEPESD